MNASDRASVRFIALMAYLMSTAALGVDAMMTSLPDIGRAFAISDPEHAQLVISVFVLCIGLGVFVAGPLADALGRKPVLLGGLLLYALGSMLAANAPSFDGVLWGRALQGLGAAAPRVVVMAIVRDRFSGRKMASTASLITMIFVLVPGVAPLLGAWIAEVAGWRAVFAAFVSFALIGAAWLTFQQPETLLPAHRRPLRPARILGEFAEILKHRSVRLAIAIQSMISAMVFAILASTQMVFDQSFGLAGAFPYIMGAVSLFGGLASLANARLVSRLGMVRLTRLALGSQSAVTFAMLVVVAMVDPAHWLAMPSYLVFKTAVFFVLGFVVGNLNAYAMQPLGHLAGTTASVLAAGGSVAGALISIPIGLSFDGTPVPLMIGVTLCGLGAFWLSMRLVHDLAD